MSSAFLSAAAHPLFGIAALTVPAIAQEQAFYYAE
jgi:hypothetical protein